MPLIYEEETTGNEIIFFIRQGKLYAYLRDRKTKKFIKRIMEFYVITHAVFERCYAERKGRGRSKSNNLHVESHSSTYVFVEFNSLEEVLDAIASAIEENAEKVNECFDKFGVDPDVIENILGLEEIGEVCYYDRCE